MRISSLEGFEPGQRAAVVVDWEGERMGDAAALHLSVPDGWRIVGATSFSPLSGSTVAEVRRSENDATEVLVLPDDPADVTAFVVELIVAESAARGRALFAPAYLQNDRIEPYAAAAVVRAASVTQSTTDGGTRPNHVGVFERGDGLTLRRDLLPDISGRAPHAVSFWLRTTGTNEVVLSDWTGREGDDYACEFIVTGDGRLAYYTGSGGVHESLASGRPVSDGRWHHVVLTHDGSGGWTRLFVDGLAVDSMYTDRSDAPLVPFVAGRRVRPAPGDAGSLRLADSRGFTGALDDVAFWPSALQPAAVRALSTGSEFVDEARFVVDFETTVAPSGPRIVANAVNRRVPVAGLGARFVEGAVEISWESHNRYVRSFVIEKSEDGESFDEVGSVPAEAGFAGRFAFVDRFVDEDVAYYRIGEEDVYGWRRFSPVLKVGTADVMVSSEDESAMLAVSNFPNPFRDVTSIAYEVPGDGYVEVSVWDLSGQPVATLVNETKQAGLHEVTFAGGDISAGTYFVRVRQGAYIASHKLLLVK